MPWGVVRVGRPGKARGNDLKQAGGWGGPCEWVVDSKLQAGAECAGHLAEGAAGEEEGVWRSVHREIWCRGKKRPRSGGHWARRMVGAGAGVAPPFPHRLMLWILGVGSDCDP